MISEKVGKLLEGIKEIRPDVQEVDVQTGHAYLANLIRSKAYWVWLIDGLDAELVNAVGGLMKGGGKRGFISFQPMDDRVYMVVLIPKDELAVERAADFIASEPWSGRGRAERRRARREILQGKRDIFWILEERDQGNAMYLMQCLDLAPLPA